MSVQMSGTFPPQQGTSNYANASQQPGPYPNMGMMPGQQGRPFANAMNTMSMPPINAPPGMSMPPPGVGRSQPMNVNTSSIPNKMMAPPPGMTTMNPNMMQQRSMAPPPQSSNTPPTSSSSSASKFPSMSGGYSDMMGMYNKGPGPASYTQAVLTMQQQQQQQQPQMKPPVLSKQQQQESEFSLVTEDFPALPGYKESGGSGQQQQQSQQQQQQNFYNQQQQFKAMSQQQQGGQQQQQNYVMNEPPRNMSSYEQFLIQRQQQQGGQQQQQQQTPQQMPPNQQQQQQKKQFVPDRYGLLGLLSVIRMIDADLNTLALGTELTTLGLNLNSPDCLYSTFASPWAEGPSRREPEYYIPMCYYTPNPLQSPFLRMNLYSEETLLYIFYSMPRDMLQIAAASELHRRDWRYHKEHKLWLTRAPNTEPTQKTPTFERGSYIFFDTTSWDKVRKDNFVLMYDQIEPPSNAATNVMNNATSAAVSSNPQVVV